jgi:hypothetical protein
MPDYCERKPNAPLGAIFGFIAFVHPATGHGGIPMSV